jgi:hypothetical protein
LFCRIRFISMLFFTYANNLARCIKYVAPIIQLVSRDHVCRFENESQHGEMMVQGKFVLNRGVAYYVILPRQGVWRLPEATSLGLPEAPNGVQGQSPVGGLGGKALSPPISEFEQFRVLLQNSHKNMSQLYTIVHS